jgi:serine/threonine protein phosphatase PrpC
MLQNEAVFLAVLTVLAVLVIGLLVTVVVLAKSLKTKTKTDSNANAQTKSASPTKGGSETADAKPSILPSARTGSSPEASEDEADITRVRTFADSKELPRLSVEERESDASQEAEEAFEESVARLVFDTEAEVDLEEPTGPQDVILMSAVGQTDRGITRRRNEDAYLIDTNRQLYAVADGMGGYAGGDVASKLALQEIWNAMEAPTESPGYPDRPRRGRELIAAVERANAAVFRESQTMRNLQGMGTTIVAARFSPQKQRLYVAHVGDSRCYRFRRGELQALTKDHTLASRGVIGPLAKNICRAVGIGKTVKVDLVVDKPLPDDIFLLCSDGLPKMVTDEHIRRILTANEGALDRAAAQLVLAANASGGRDNITVVLVRILEITKTMQTAAIVRSQHRVEFGPS